MRKIDAHLKDGNFVDNDGKILAGQDELKSLKDRCWRWTEIVLERYVIYSAAMEPILTDLATAKERSMSVSRINMTPSSTSETNSTAYR